MAAPIRFTASPPGGDRVHHAREEDVRVLLGRLPAELYRRLRAVHFNDRSRGGRMFGYVTRGRREIALCALPPRMSLTRSLVHGEAPEEFGARRGVKWPPLAVRRFMLYDLFLHELGHMQVVDAATRSDRLKFARERLANEFAAEWRHRLWAESFDHADPVHNAPSAQELATMEAIVAAL